jgi:hypothetical protein
MHRNGQEILKINKMNYIVIHPGLIILKLVCKGFDYSF